MLKIFTDQQFLTETHRKEVFPLLFDLWFLKSEKLSSYFQLVNSVEACNIVVFPINYTAFIKYKQAFDDLLKSAKKNKKTIWIYTSGDYGFTNYISNSYTFRLGGFDSKLDNSIFIMPSFINDPYNTLKKEFTALNIEKQPSIGFVGHAQFGVLKYFNEWFNHLKLNTKRLTGKVMADKQSFYPSSIKRAQYLSLLSKSKGINTNFILRNKYRAGVKTKETKEKTTLEFYNNMYGNAYTFCCRGGGNFRLDYMKP